jgi:hypothetical protein
MPTKAKATADVQKVQIAQASISSRQNRQHRNFSIPYPKSGEDVKIFA